MAEEPQRPGGGAGRGRAGRAGSGRAGSGRTSGGRPSRARREATPGSTGPSRPKVERPPLPEGVDWLALDVDVRGQLRSLPKSLAETVGSHLAAAGLLLDEDADAAYEHAGLVMLDRCEVLVAIWDGMHAQGQGGTGGLVAEARRRAMPVAWVHAGNRRTGTVEPTSLGDQQGAVSFERLPDV